MADGINIPTMQELEDQMLGKKKPAENKEAEVKEPEQPEETKAEKLAKLKEQAKEKRHELDDIYNEIENTI